MTEKASSVTLYYITLCSLDPELVRMIVGCGICHMNTKNMCTVQPTFSHKEGQEDTVIIRIFEGTVPESQVLKDCIVNVFLIVKMTCNFIH
jgi:hypothetical protein